MKENIKDQVAICSPFLKSLIKIAHPDWTEAQIEQECIRKATIKDQPEDTGQGCEFCSG